jgi:serine phosphatase RsbU (regulator of sigma subunit)
MAVLMNQRSARLLGERQRLGREMESAAEVQSLLLTSRPAAGEAWQIEPVYLPASEVGGDFYRIFSAGDGAILVVVGDVSGKGLRAAMTVSGLTCAMEVIRTRRPGAFLAELNRAAAAHLQSGFATCCAALIQPDGEAVIANAGHPAPYCDGKELVLEGGLPLGIAAEGEYPETIARGERFTFVSDGVVEAENPQRELFGFERTREISGQAARAIAEAAKAWGQNDDITVVTVWRNG